MTVRILADTVVDRIAAGEVVERPASVLKELIENALDAGATSLDVELKLGGVGLVRVTDDGTGMCRGDALLAIERHATSKITTADDLVGVETHGFRGEALPSIASVSMFELTTRTAGEEVGTRLRIDGGSLEGVDAVAAPVGTTVAVRSLFHHVPARRKFLRGASTELAHCLEVVRREVVRRPAVGVRVRHDGREVLRADPVDAVAARVRDVLGEDAGVLVPVVGGREGVALDGLVSPAGVHRPSATGSLYLYVNGRFVQDRVLRRAMTEAWRGVLPAGRHPIVVLDVRVPPSEVDVNVHPAKTEVRFARPALVAEVVAAVVRDALRGPVRVAARPPRGEVPVTDDTLPLLAGLEGGGLSRVAAHPDDDPWLRHREPAVVWRAAASAESRLADAALAPLVAEAPAPPAPIAAPEPTPPRREASPVLLQEPPSTTLRSVSVLSLLPGGMALGVLGDLAVVLDVTACWRTWVASRLLSGKAPARPLLAPAVAELGREAVHVVAHVEDLAELGVDVAAFGPGALALMGAPELLDVSDPRGLLEAAAAAAPRGRGALATALSAFAGAPPGEVHAVATLLAGLDEVSPGVALAPPLAACLDGAALRGLVGG